MKVKVSELTGAALDWAVARAEGWTRYEYGGSQFWMERGRDARGARILKSLHELAFSTRPDLAWSIIEREGIGFYDAGPKWWASPRGEEYTHEGPTSLIAAMRCYVASKLGDEVDVPDELMEN